jgi:predicted RNase H-like HicB family nuclease
MKAVYPAIFTQTDRGYVIHVPDMNIDTQGRDLAEAIHMARDAIGIMSIDIQDDGKEPPHPSDVASVRCGAGDIVSMVDIDLDGYRNSAQP